MASESSSKKSREVGDSIAVLYLADKPHSARVRQSMYAGPIYFTLFVGLLAGTSAVLWVSWA